jgi:hypothetical protein
MRRPWSGTLALWSIEQGGQADLPGGGQKAVAAAHPDVSFGRTVPLRKMIVLRRKL